MVKSTQGHALTWLVHLGVLFLVLAWTIPTAGLFVSSFRDKAQLSNSGWWTSFADSERALVGRTEDLDKQQQKDGNYVLSGNLFLFLHT